MFDTRRLETAMRQARINGNELAARLKTSAANVSRIRTGRQQPRKPLREAIERELGLEVGALDIKPADVTTARLRLDPLERLLIETMQGLTQHEREIVLAYAQGMAGQPAARRAKGPPA